jgi:penicillin-binding protein 1A
MAHAYDTLAEDGRLTSGTMAAHTGGPVGILKVTDSDGHLVAPENSDASGLDKPTSEQAIPSSVAQEAKSILETVVASGTGTHAQTGQYEWGKTGTTTDNGDAWFVGATKDITVAIWVGYPDSNKSMSTLYGGQPVDGGTYPADIFRQIVESWDQLKREERANHQNPGTYAPSSSSGSSSSYSGVTTTPTTTTAAPTVTPTTSTPPSSGGGTTQAPAPAPAQPAAPAPAPATRAGWSSAG